MTAKSTALLISFVYFICFQQAGAQEFFAPRIQIIDEVTASDIEASQVDITITHSKIPISANLYFREKGTTNEYRYVPLIKTANSNRYIATITKQSVSSDSIEAYVEVLDVFGNRSQFPPAETPRTIAVLYYTKLRQFPSKPAHWISLALGAAVLLGAIAGSDSSGTATPTLSVTAPLPE